MSVEFVPLGSGISTVGVFLRSGSISVDIPAKVNGVIPRSATTDGAASGEPQNKLSELSTYEQVAR
jgi:hypothetical protein